jgi:hypothetical protein
MNLGINNRHMFNENIDYGLNQHIEQGIQYKKYGQQFYKENQHTLLAHSSSSEWGSIVEAFTGDDSTQKKKTVKEGMSSSYDNTRFNNLISDYATNHKTYSSTMLGRTQPTDAMRIAMEESLTKQRNDIVANANQIQSSLDSTTGPNLMASLANNQDKLNGYLKALEEQKAAGTDENRYDETTISGAIETTGLNMNSMYYHYIVYFFISITLISFTFNILVNPNANVMNAIIVVGALFLIYFIMRRNAV